MSCYPALRASSYQKEKLIQSKKKKVSVQRGTTSFQSDKSNMNSKLVIFVFAIVCASVAVFGLPTQTDDEPSENVATRADCSLAMVMGVCRARMPRWGYDAQKKECVSFFYGGCQGNANNFQTKEECVQTCEGV